MTAHDNAGTDSEGRVVTGTVEDVELRWPVLVMVALPFILMVALVGFNSSNLQTVGMVSVLFGMLMAPVVWAIREVWARIPRAATLRLGRHDVEFLVPWSATKVPLSGISGCAREKRTRTRFSLLTLLASLVSQSPEHRETSQERQRRQRRQGPRTWAQEWVVIRVWGEAGSFEWGFVKVNERAIDELLKALRDRIEHADEAPR